MDTRDRKGNRRRRIIGILVLLTLVVGALAWRASWIAHRLLRSWASTTVRDKSGGVYELAVGQVRLNFPLRRVSVDSLVVTTNDAANALRGRPLASLGLVLHDCKITGVHLIPLIRGQGLVAGSFGCNVVDARFVVPAGVPDPDMPPTAPGAPGAMLVLQQGIQLPSFAPRMQIGSIDFPEVALDFHVQHAKGGDSRIELERFRWSMKDFDMDPADAASAARPMFSGKIELGADNLVFHPDSDTVLRFASMSASLTDSTLDARGFTVGPTLGRAAYDRVKPYRRKYSAMRTARIEARGVDVRALFLGEGLRARSALVDSMLLNISNDHLKPVKPGPKDHRRTPQQWIAQLDRPLNVDSVVVMHSKVVYQLRNAGHDEFGIITFARINGLALGVNTSVAGARTRAPMRLAVTTYFQDAGLLTVHFAVPLRAPRFEMTYRGTLGPMEAEHVNQFVQSTTPIRITHGQVDGIEFSGTVTNGFTTGSVTPLYSNFAFAVNQEDSKGLLARNGFLGGVARKVASFAGNWKKVYAVNPEDRHHKPRVGQINHPFDGDQALPDYLWYGLRDGLVQVIAR